MDIKSLSPVTTTKEKCVLVIIITTRNEKSMLTGCKPFGEGDQYRQSAIMLVKKIPVKPQKWES